MIKQRHLEPELMDQPDLDPSLHRDALRGLRRINVLSCSAAIMWPEIVAAARRIHPRTLRVLDLACGGGDNAIALAARRLPRRRADRSAWLRYQFSGCECRATACRGVGHKEC